MLEMRHEFVVFTDRLPSLHQKLTKASPPQVSVVIQHVAGGNSILAFFSQRGSVNAPRLSSNCTSLFSLKPKEVGILSVDVRIYCSTIVFTSFQRSGL